MPTGALVAVQLPDPALRAAVQMVVEPMVKVTVPVGVPPEPDTVAE